MGISTEDILENREIEDLPWAAAFREHWSKHVSGTPTEYIRLYGRIMRDTLIASAARQAFEAGWKAREEESLSDRERRRPSRNPIWGPTFAGTPARKSKPKIALKAKRPRRKR